MSDIFREIDEELRRDHLLKLLSRYWPYLAAIVGLALAIAGGITFWHQHQLSLRQAQSNRYAVAATLASRGKSVEAARLFGAVAREGGGYAELAAFQEAALLAQSGHEKEALAIYDHIATTDPHPAFRGLAVLLSTMRQMPQTAPKEIIARLKPLTVAGNPWRASALELTALAEIAAGDRSGARRIYQGLTTDPAAPPGLRARAAELAAALAS